MFVFSCYCAFVIRTVPVDSSIFLVNTSTHIFERARRDCEDLQNLCCKEGTETRNLIFESIWERKLHRYQELLQQRQALGNNKTIVTAKNAYDLYEPLWNCENEERFGGEFSYAIGDGPKWTCGLSALGNQSPRRAPCLVYSIGSHYDFSFEYAVHERLSHCEIHTFDGTLDLSIRDTPRDLYSRNIHFHNWNVISTYSAKNSNLTKEKTMRQIIRELNHTGKTIQIFKIDCEGCEYAVLPELFESDVEVQQLMVELHGTQTDAIANIFNNMSDHHMLLFHKERNHYGCDGYRCVEFSFVSKEFAKAALLAYLLGE